MKKATQLYLILNKPIDYSIQKVSGLEKSIFDLLPLERFDTLSKENIHERLMIMNELPSNAEGLVLLTTDRTFVNDIRNELSVTFEIMLDRELQPNAEKILQKGMIIDNVFLPGIEIKKTFNKGKRTIVTVVVPLGQEKNILIMFERIGYMTRGIRCVSLGKARIGVLSVGQWQQVQKRDIV